MRLRPWIVAGLLVSSVARAQELRLAEATIDDVHAALKAGHITCRELVQLYLDRIEAYNRNGPNLNAVQFINPRALAEADALDASLESSGLVGPLHPLLDFTLVREAAAVAVLASAGSYIAFIRYCVRIAVRAGLGGDVAVIGNGVGIAIGTTPALRDVTLIRNGVGIAVGGTSDSADANDAVWFLLDHEHVEAEDAAIAEGDAQQPIPQRKAGEERRHATCTVDDVNVGSIDRRDIKICPEIATVPEGQ